MKKVVFERGAFVDFTEWAEIDRKIHRRICTLIMDILRQPHTGLGQPEPLKHELQSYWSRRINQEPRLVYRIKDESVVIIA